MLVAQEWKHVQVRSSKGKRKEKKTLLSKLPSLGKRQGLSGENLLQNPLAARSFMDSFVAVPAWLLLRGPLGVP